MKKSLKFTLSATIAAIALGISLLIGVPAIIMMYNFLGTSVAEYSNLTIDMAENKVNQYINGPVNVVKTAERYLEADDLEQDATETFFRNMIKDNPAYTMLYYANDIAVHQPGGLLWSDNQWNPAQDFDQTTRGWFKGALAAESYFISQPYVDAQSGKLVSGVSMKVNKSDGSDCVVSLDMEIEALNDLVKDLKISKNGQSFVIDKDGKYVTNPDQSKIMKTNFFDDFKVNYDLSKAMDGKSQLIYSAGNGYYLAIKLVSKESGWIFVTVGKTQDLFGKVTNSLVIVGGIAVLCFIISIGIGILIAIRLIKPISKVDATVNEIASGNADLTNRIKLTSENEVGSLVKGFNKFVEKLQGIVTEIKNSKVNLDDVKTELVASLEESSSSINQIIANIESIGVQVNNQSSIVDQTSTAVNEIAENINSLERMIETQSSGVTQASAAVEQMIGNINSVNQSVTKMAESFGELEQKSNQGVAYQTKVMEQIKSIEEQSKSLQSANSAIQAVAAQTNLLAMNAAIEAAHAGEAGKGFSVVADEIRKLSESTSGQSKSIGNELKNIMETIGMVVQGSQVSSQNFNEVSSQISSTDMLVRQIKSAMEEQNEGSKQIVSSLKMMNDSTVEVKNASTEMQEGNQLILKEVKELQNATFAIKTSMDEMSSGAKVVNEAGSKLSELSTKVNESVDSIGSQIDMFKV